MSFSPRPLDPLGCSSIQEQRDFRQNKFCRIAKEMVQTEQRYCQKLELVTTFFVDILKAKGTLRSDIREDIFCSIKAIQSANQTLLIHLENGYFGKGLDQFSTRMHHYYTYVDNINKAQKVLQMQLKKNKAFRRFKKLQESRPEFNNQKLEDLLQLPLQRIDQYKHFLQELTANMSLDNPEYEQLSRATTAVCEVSHRIDDNTRHHENHLELCRVQKLLKGRKMKVLAPGRWYICEGWLKVVPPKGAEAKPKMFFLFSDMLLQAKCCSSLQSTSGQKFTAEHAYPLQDCTVEKVFGHTRSQGGLLSLTFPRADLLLMSSNQENLNKWYQSLSSAIREQNSQPTAIYQRDELGRRPLRSAADSHNTPGNGASRKRNAVTAEISELPEKPPVEQEYSAPKRMKPCDASGQSAETSSCVIL